MDICGTYVFCQRFVRISLTNPKKEVVDSESSVGLYSQVSYDNGITMRSIPAFCLGTGYLCGRSNYPWKQPFTTRRRNYEWPP
jgi:hypothetical protein